MSKAHSMLSLGLGSFVIYDQFIKHRLESPDSFGVFLSKLFTSPETIKYKIPEQQKENNDSIKQSDDSESKYSDFLSNIKTMIPAGVPILKIPIETILDNPKNSGLFLISAILFAKRRSIKKRASGLMYVTRNSFSKNMSSLKSKINKKFAQTGHSIKVLLQRVHLLKGEVKKTQEKIDDVKKDTEKLKTKTEETKTLTQRLLGLAKNTETDTKNLRKQNQKIERKVDEVKTIVENNGSSIDRLKQYLAPNIFEKEPSPRKSYKIGERTGESDEDIIVEHSDLETEADSNIVNTADDNSISPISSQSDVLSTGEVVNTNDEEGLIPEEENGDDNNSWFPNIKLPSLP
jgi:hypothetical protein